MTEKCGEVVIRDAVPADAERIREIYDYYVRHTAISFEYETPGLRLRGAFQGEGGL